MKATLYLIPVPISDNPSRQVHSDEVTVVMKKIDVFIVENVNTARKHLRRAGHTRWKVHARDVNYILHG